MFSGEFYKILFFTEHLSATASTQNTKIFKESE